MAASHTIPELTRAIGARAVHLRLVPRPEGMAESREILRLLQGHGKVEMFKNLKYDAVPTPNTMLAIFQSEDVARQFLHRSPLRFNMSRHHVEEDSVEENYSASEAPGTTQSLPNNGRSSAARPAQHSSTISNEPETREYQLQVNIATIHHRDHINVNSYNGPFIVGTKSAVQEDLARQVPLFGLSEVNLQKAEKPWKVVKTERAIEGRERRTLRQMLEEGELKARFDTVAS